MASLNEAVTTRVDPITYFTTTNIDNVRRPTPIKINKSNAACIT